MGVGRVKTKMEKSGGCDANAYNPELGNLVWESTDTNSRELVAYSENAVRNNSAIVEYCRTSMAALSGATAGLLGLTGLFGFVFYVFSVIGLWVLLMIKAGSHWKKFFINRRTILTNGFFGSLFTYVLSWTFIYGMVHVY